MILTFDDMMKLCESKPELRAKEEVVNGRSVTIFSYMVSMTDTFSSAMSREFRGIVFCNETEQCICRPLPKFFNVGEREDTQERNINWDNAVFYTKHDGSMLTPVLINNEIVWKTKNTFFSDVANSAQAFYEKCRADGITVPYANEKQKDILKRYTPIYEYVGPHNQIVMPYATEQFIFLGMRNILTGKYTPAKSLIVPDLKYNDVYNLEEQEGFVIWDGTQLVKAKTKWYLERHKITSDFNPKAIINAVFDNTIDDMLGTISQLGLMLRFYQVQELRDKVVREQFNVLYDVDLFWKLLQKQNCSSRKDYAIYINAGEVPKHLRGIMFKMLDERDVQVDINKIVFENVYAEYKPVDTDE